MTPAEVTRLIMFLFDASENDEISSSQLSEPASGIIAEDYSADHDNSLTSAFRSRNPLFGTSRPSSSSSDTLKTLKGPTSQNNHTTPSLNTSVERESRKTGLSLTELQKAIEMGRKNGEWSCLISLLNSVFSSYDALSTSFLHELCGVRSGKQSKKDKKTTDVSDSSLCCTSAKTLKDYNEVIPPTVNNSDGSVDNIIESSWVEGMTSISTDFPVYQNVS
ncbi:Ribonucleases P/MRP protein subunit pop1, variant 2 [Schistosoma haematobium]|uniref:Ribonucleases P/MRP protein subunit pop1, variant 2 n=1 Tax=Schistosoma haematobium TaxID=6185 RepID=A0A922LKX2_SCHHA|nr:Ribonucleases P/MRP protein subunit pop1, variant 2 [Schistosoma haematobium]KAH9588134.1 Ribonucleases P/MRP protein subunit pop1, variant 2 [Schistosoma haematobium]